MQSEDINNDNIIDTPDRSYMRFIQTPQIFNEFGIKSAILGRGTNEDTPSFIKWQSPDGSFLTTFVLEPEEGYGSFERFLMKNP